MRIISGNLKGSTLNMPKNKNTRPLKDIAKENITKEEVDLTVKVITSFLNKQGVQNYKIEDFYQLNNKFLDNKKILHIIKYLFLYRTLAFTLLNFKFNDSEPVNLLDKCLKGIQCYEN